MREACGPAHMKVILGVGECGSLTTVYQASLVAMMAGADFIKTSTGKEGVNATLPIGIVMCRAIREFHEVTGYKVAIIFKCTRYSISVVTNVTCCNIKLVKI